MSDVNDKVQIHVVEQHLVDIERTVKVLLDELINKVDEMTHFPEGSTRNHPPSESEQTCIDFSCDERHKHVMKYLPDVHSNNVDHMSDFTKGSALNKELNAEKKLCDNIISDDPDEQDIKDLLEEMLNNVDSRIDYPKDMQTEDMLATGNNKSRHRTILKLDN